MLSYCFHIILASSLFVIFYKLILENERMHVFKRFYLLGSVILSLIIPAIEIHIESSYKSIQLMEYLPVNVSQLNHGALETAAPSNPLSVSEIFLSVYILVTVTLVMRILFMMRRICNMINTSSRVVKSNATYVLLENSVSPFSFFQFIFLDCGAYRAGTIDAMVIKHELAHVKQRHSLDVIFVELVTAIFWFNPMLMFYKKAIQLNHEFIADNAAVDIHDQIPHYQSLILEHINPGLVSLTSHFNYSFIKKRFVMIKKQSSFRTNLMYASMAIFFCIGVFLMLTISDAHAQPSPASTSQNSNAASANGATPEMMQEYQLHLANYKPSEKSYPFSQEDAIRLMEIYAAMNEEQRVQADQQIASISSQRLFFRPKPGLKKYQHPTRQQLLQWQDGRNYFVRINGRKIDNATLKDLEPAELFVMENYFPPKGSTDYGKYIAQVNLVTPDAREKSIVEWEQRPGFVLAFRLPGPNRGTEKH